MSGLFDDLRDLYQEIILDHGRRPRNFHRLDDADATARGDNPMCGDRIERSFSAPRTAPSPMPPSRRAAAPSPPPPPR